MSFTLNRTFLQKLKGFICKFKGHDVDTVGRLIINDFDEQNSLLLLRREYSNFCKRCNIPGITDIKSLGSGGCGGGGNRPEWLEDGKPYISAGGGPGIPGNGQLTTIKNKINGQTYIVSEEIKEIIEGREKNTKGYEFINYPIDKND